MAFIENGYFLIFKNIALLYIAITALIYGDYFSGDWQTQNYLIVKWKGKKYDGYF